VSDITVDQLKEILSGDPEELGKHLSLVKKDIAIVDSKTTLHVHCLTVDAMGKVQLARLAEYMRDTLTDYAIPRSKLQTAKDRDAKFKQTSAVTKLHHQALNLFTDLANTGEGGEMLLYLLAERYLKIPQVLCKMDLKTDTAMHYHGADGVYASARNDGILKLYWGESKIYKDASDAIRDCLKSLTPFLQAPEGEDSERERDLILLSDKADLSDEKLTGAFRKYFDTSSPKSNRVEYCGVALVGFNCDCYPPKDAKAVADEVAKKAEAAIEAWSKQIKNRADTEKVHDIEIQFFCIPLPSADDFREAFLKALGKV
jgi:Cap4 SAVED domain